MSRRSRRRDESITRRRKVERPRLLAQAKRNAQLRPVAVAILALSVVGGGALIFLSDPFVGVVVILFGGMVATGLWASAPLSCPACGTPLEVEGERGLFSAAETVTCTKCRVKGHPS